MPRVREDNPLDRQPALSGVLVEPLLRVHQVAGVSAPILHIKFIDAEKTFCGRRLPSPKVYTDPNTRVCKTCEKAVRVHPKSRWIYFGVEYNGSEWVFTKPRFHVEVTGIMVEPLEDAS